VLLVELSRHREAIASFAQVTALAPDFAAAHWAEALNRLRLGDFEAGWRKYEWRQQTATVGLGLRQFDLPPWIGNEDPAGLRILLHAEQGYGDTLQFCRYAPLLAERGARVILLVQRPLLSLLRGLARVDVRADGDALPEFDRHCPLMSLPFAFRTRVDNVPAEVPYLRADPARASRWKDLLGPRSRPRVGLVWSGNVRHEKDRERSLPLRMLAPLFETGAEFVGLVRDIRERDRADLALFALRPLGEQVSDFADTAALIDNLDLVITVDTSVAHLAGAMAKPTWILLDSRPDFRWMLDREDSPWYPTARLLRQRAPGDWTGVVERVAAELDALVRAGANVPCAAAEPFSGYMPSPAVVTDRRAAHCDPPK
jgi:hypothetical protein